MLLLLLSHSLLASPAFAETYLLNPRGANLSSVQGLPLPKEDQDLWLKAIYQRVELISSGNAEQLRDDSDESLETKIQKASEAYLQLNWEEADGLVGDAYDLMAKSMPYAQMNEDLVTLASLKVMIAEQSHGQSKKGKVETPPEALPFMGDKTFLSKVPMKIMGRLSELNTNLYKITAASLAHPNLNRLFLSGREVKLPAQLKQGKYLMHTLEGDTVSIGWLNVGLDPAAKDDAGIKVERLRERSLWTALPIQNLSKAALATRPAKWSKASVSVMSQNSSGEFSPLLLTAGGEQGTPGKKTALADANSLSKSPPIGMTTDSIFKSQDPYGFDSWDKKDNWKDVHEGSSIFRNPWFWVGVGVVVGAAGGYAIYEGTKSSPSVATP